MIPIIWTAHLQNNPDAKKDFESALQHSTVALSRLLEIIEISKDSLDKIENTSSSYDNPGWSHKQAHINGKRAALKDIEQLLQFTRG